MANKRTVIAPDEELLVQGKLTITGNVTQVEETTVVTNLQGNTFTVNSDGDNVTANIILNSNGSLAVVSYNASGNIVFSRTIEGNVFIPGGASITGNVFTGNAAGADALTSPVTIEIAGDGSASNTFINAGDTATLALVLNTVNSNVDTFGNASTIPTFTVNAKGLVTSASENSVNIVSSQVSDFDSAIDSHLSGSTGITYNTGAISITNTGVGADTYGAADIVPVFTVNAQGQLTSASNANIEIVSTQVSDFNAAVDSYVTTNTIVRTIDAQTIDGEKTFTGQVNVTNNIIPTAANSYNLGSWANHFDQVFANVVHAEKLDLGDADLTDIHSTFYAGTASGTILDTSTAGGLVYTHNGPGEVNPGGYYRVNPGDGLQISSNAVTVDSTVVRTNVTQTIASNTTFTGAVDLTGSTATASTQANSDSSSKLATTLYVDNAVANLIDGAPGALDTLNELANALNDDASLGSIVTSNTNRISTLEGRDLIAGAGLTGGGTLSADRTFNIGAGDGITVNADSIEINTTFIDNTVDSHLSGDTGITYTNGAIAITNTGVSSGTYGNASISATFTVNAQGQITTASQSAIDITASQVSDFSSSANSAMDAYLTAGDGIGITSGAIFVDSTVVRTTGNQSISGTKTFTGALIAPDSATASNGSIYYDNTLGEAFIYVNGMARKITPAVDAGDVEGIGTGDVDIYGGTRMSGNTVFHGIKSISGDSYTTVTESSNVVIVDANIAAIKEQFSASGAEFSYDDLTGTFTSTADNYLQWKFVTPTTGNVVVNSDDLVTFAAGSGIQITNVGKTITFTNTNSADITEVAAGNGLTGGGSSGVATLNVGAGTGISVAADSISTNDSAIVHDNLSGYVGDEHIDHSTVTLTAGDGISGGGDITTSRSFAVDGTVVRTSGNQTIADDKTFTGTTQINDLSINGAYSFPTADGSTSQVLTTNGTGTLSFQSVSSIGLTSVTGGDGLTATSGIGSVELDVGAGYGITVNADDIEVSNSDIRALFSAGGDLSYNSTTGQFSFTNDAGDIESVTAGNGLVGGGTTGSVTLDVVGGTGITVNANNIELDNTSVTSGSYGGSSKYVTFEVDAQGRLTAATDGDIAIASSQVSGLATSATTDTTNASNITSGTLASARLPNLTVADFAGSAIQTGAEAFADSDSVLMTAAAVQDKIESYGYSTTTGTVTSISGGSGLTPGSITTSGTLAVGAGSYILVGTDDVSVDATSSNTAGKVVARDGSGNFAAGVITATATAAQYADLAEKYVADADYEPGTVVVFGGDKEITAADRENDHRVAGVISTDPAYMMNSDIDGLYVALRGRIPCKVIGPVKKGDVLITSTKPGYAKASDQPHFVSASCIVGKALENLDAPVEGVIEVVV